MDSAARGMAAQRTQGTPRINPRWSGLCSWIEGYLLGHRYAPSMREVAEHLGMASTQSAWFTLHRMRSAGLVDWREIGQSGSAAPRTLHVTEAGRRAIGGRARELAELRLREVTGRLDDPA